MSLFCTVKIGNISITFNCPSSSWLSFIKTNYGPFILQTTDSHNINVLIQPLFKPERARKKLEVCKIHGNWHIKRYDFQSSSSNNFRQTVLTSEKNKYAFDTWLRVFFTLCGINLGTVLLHGAGYSFRNSTYIFPGRSGRGKSTIISILGKSNALTDELVCVFRNGRNFFAASTPFWGELKKGTGKLYSGKLKKLLFLKHDKMIKTCSIARHKAVKELLKTVLFFSKYPAHIELLLNLLQELSFCVPGVVLSFRKHSAKKDILKTLR